MSETNNRRRDDRLDVRWKAHLLIGDEKLPCEVADVSFAGTLVVLSGDVHPGQEVILDVDGLGQFAARVQWTQKSRCGLSLVAGPDLLLKRLAEASREYPSSRPGHPEDIED